MRTEISLKSSENVVPIHLTSHMIAKCQDILIFIDYSNIYIYVCVCVYVCLCVQVSFFACRAHWHDSTILNIW